MINSIALITEAADPGWKFPEHPYFRFGRADHKLHVKRNLHKYVMDMFKKHQVLWDRLNKVNDDLEGGAADVLGDFEPGATQQLHAWNRTLAGFNDGPK